MLWLGELVVAAVITAIFVWLLSVAMRAGPNSADGGISSGSGWLLFLFLLLLLPTWGGGIWLMPLGPAFFGIRIVNFLLMGLVMALVIGAILAATSNVHAPQPTESERLPREELLARQQLNSWNQFFWILLVLMVVSLFWGYWWL